MLETRRCRYNGSFVQRGPGLLADRLGSSESPCRSVEFARNLGYGFPVRRDDGYSSGERLEHDEEAEWLGAGKTGNEEEAGWLA